MTTFGDRVKLAREAKGLTQGELATKVGMTQGQISKLELGIRKKSTKTFQIALATEANMVFLETGNGPMLGDTPATDLEQRVSPSGKIAKDELARLELLYLQLPKATRTFVLLLLEGAAGISAQSGGKGHKLEVIKPTKVINGQNHQASHPEAVRAKNARRPG